MPTAKLHSLQSLNVLGKIAYVNRELRDHDGVINVYKKIIEVLWSLIPSQYRDSLVVSSLLEIGQANFAKGDLVSAAIYLLRQLLYLNMSQRALS